MIIIEEKKKKNIFFSFNKFLFLYFFVTLFFGLILAGFIFSSYTFKKAKTSFLDYFSKAGRYEYLYLPNITIKALKSNFYKINKLDLEIQFDDILIIENVRNDAIANGSLPTAALMPKVKTNIILNKKKYRADIRLKGDRDVHFKEKNKSSYKLELDKNQYIFGLKKFSLQKPRLRNYIHEWIFHEMAKDFNIIKIKYDFINLSINGENKGLYVIEEGFGKELIERNERRNGPIFGLDEDVFGGYDKPVFEIYNKKYWARDENNSLARVAAQKLGDFFNGQSELNQVFDLERWAAYFAVVDMTSNYHGAHLKSVKLYYNPINGLIEPIGYDGHRHKPNYHKFNVNYDDRILIDIVTDPLNEDEIRDFTWLKKFFFKNEKLNQEFYNLYLENLNNISSKTYVNKFLLKNLKKIEEINSHIYADYFYYDNIRNYGSGLYYFLLDDYFHQVENIQKKLKAKSNIQVLKKGSSEFIIKNYYKNYGALIVDKFICDNYSQKVEIKVNKLVKNFSDTIIKLPKEQIKNLHCTHVNFVNKYNENSFLHKVDYINSDYYYEEFKNIKFERLGKYFVQEDKQLFLLNDEIIIDQNLYIPKGLKVIVKPNQKIFLTNNAFIISNSPWIIGGKGGKVVITGEKNNLGGGILISDNKEYSKIQNTKISYLTGHKQNLDSEFLIFGSINFHQTNVEINNVNFENIYSEDAINIFRSSFKINNNNYFNIDSDAIDIDFSDGEINSVNFENVENDAIDFSGSNVTIYNSSFKNVNDKLISAGENSKINISKIKALNSHAGIISKDGSEVYSSDIDFNGVLIPFAAYQKKKEYKYGTLIVKNYDINNFYTKWIKDKESKIIINNMPMEIETKKILSIINEKKLFLLK